MGREYSRDICIHAEDQRASTKEELQAVALKFQIVTAPGGVNLVLTNQDGESITLQQRAQ